MKSQRFVFFMMLGIGFLALICTAALIYRTSAFIRTAGRVPGVVVANQVVYGGRFNAHSFHARFVFRTEDGKSVIKTSEMGTTPPSFTPGDHIEVLYDRSAPQQAKINSFGQLWLGAILTGLMSLLFVGLPGLFWVFLRPGTNPLINAAEQAHIEPR